MPANLDIVDAPARRIIKKFGGLTKAARAWKKSKSTVQRWQESGYIHPDYYDEILNAAVVERITLDPSDFNVVDTDHPAFSAPCIPTDDDTAARSVASSTRPIRESGVEPRPIPAGAVSRSSVDDPDHIASLNLQNEERATARRQVC